MQVGDVGGVGGGGRVGGVQGSAPIDEVKKAIDDIEAQIQKMRAGYAPGSVKPSQSDIQKLYDKIFALQEYARNFGINPKQVEMIMNARSLLEMYMDYPQPYFEAGLDKILGTFEAVKASIANLNLLKNPDQLTTLLNSFVLKFLLEDAKKSLSNKEGFAIFGETMSAYFFEMYHLNPHNFTPEQWQALQAADKAMENLNHKIIFDQTITQRDLDDAFKKLSDLTDLIPH